MVSVSPARTDRAASSKQQSKRAFFIFNLSPPAPLTVSFLPGSITAPVIPGVESPYTGHIRDRQSERLHFYARDELLLVRGVGVANAETWWGEAPE